MISSKRAALAALVVLASCLLVVNVDAAEPTATKPPVASTPFAPHTVPITATPHHVPVPVWNPNTPLAKMQNHSMIPLALIVGLIGGAFLIVVAAGIFTFFWHSKRHPKSAYAPTAINDDAVTPAMVENYGDEGYGENTSLLDH